ncbi:MAG TPA: NADPH-dependent assimilatory sulfite reductase hemoprotein subunit [Planctomycetes bacterium]|nr:NADPH-dependent assimilatory sulfite reductase hemoprotein subunit [Planctomycetaceae bacterium]HIN95436.1 NADPH-dependent assimilatory sulfite reductase hemoprotein subunit [Planctomycetota bacterium]
MADAEKVSAVEGFKSVSDYLLGDICEELVDGEDFFGKGSVQLLKHHGTYQQDDRDLRHAAGAGKPGKKFAFMVRCKIPGGILTSDQLLAELDLCDQVGNTTIRITSRQGLQLHGVVKSELQQAIARINETQLTTLGACGDVCRNVMCCPAPYKTPVRQQMQALAQELASHFAPRTPAYQDLWLTDVESGIKRKIDGPSGTQLPPSTTGTAGDATEPIYGSQYLPRKFKIGIALPEDNCIDLFTHDLGFLAIVENGKIVGYNVYVGGGQGVTPAAKKTFPALGQAMAFVEPGLVVPVATAVVEVQRDHGNRVDRKVARLKYLIHNWGLEKFRDQVESYHGKSLADCRNVEVTGHDDHLGWHEQGDGKWFYGLNVENGRIRDTGTVRLKTALREICRTVQPGICLTAHQSLLFTDVEPQQRESIEGLLRQCHVPLSEEISEARRWSMACVAWPTCGLSITESERALPGMIDQLDVELEQLGLSAEQFTIRMTGCPNGCARPYNSDIGLVGKARNKYTILVGGRRLGDRLNFIHRDLVPAEEVIPTLVRLFVYFQQDRQEDETFGDFCTRKGNDDLLAKASTAD